MKSTLLLALILGIANISYAQTDKHPVAIMPFVAIDKEHLGTASRIQGMVISILSEKSNIDVIDRSSDSLVIRELDNQMREVSSAATSLADQGKLSGAQDMITGTLSKVFINKMLVNDNTGLNSKPQYKYTGSISFSLQLVDVATGRVKDKINIEGNTKKAELAGKITDGALKIFDLFSKDKKNDGIKKADDLSSLTLCDTKDEAVNLCIRSCEKKLSEWFNKTFLPAISILSFQERKNDLPETVLVSGLDETYKKKSKIIINEITYYETAGKKLKRTEKIAEMQIVDLQGEVTLCRLTKGNDIIEEKIKKGATLEFLINK